ncbi:MAG: hypothetical protein IJM41_11070 [Bacteroidales bacterium]|nr:hypothetical protein [Bacteroidales bacterium]
MNISPKELALNQKLHNLLEGNLPEVTDLPAKLLSLLIENDEIKAIQDYANTVSITRLGFNDHGPVHMRKVCCNALKMLKILHETGMKTSLENEQGRYEDSVLAVMLASFLHDIGMTVGRQDHELYSGIMAYSIIDSLLSELLPGDDNLMRRVMIRSMALEGIIGHMGSRRIHSLEAGLILIADGCDMTKGRARIPLEIKKKSVVGDIHKYSANSIEKVRITKGSEKAIRIEVHMTADVGFFQVEEVLMQKILSSPAKELVELYAGIIGQDDLKRYL